jgi:hypothetical protein
MFGRRELEKLQQQKQVLMLESRLHRLQFRAEASALRSASGWWLGLAGAPQKLSPLLLGLAPIAGFLLMRGRRGAGSSRLASVAKWLPLLYRLWKVFSELYQEHAAPRTPPPA